MLYYLDGLSIYKILQSHVKPSIHKQNLINHQQIRI